MLILKICLRRFKVINRIAFGYLLASLGLTPVPQFTEDIEVEFVIQHS